MTCNIILFVAGLVGVSCFFGAAFYLMAVAGEIRVVKKESFTVAETADPIEDRSDSH